MITSVVVNTEIEQEITVAPDWDGDDKRFVTLIIKDLNPEQQEKDGGKSAILSVTLDELRDVVKAAEIVLEGQTK